MLKLALMATNHTWLPDQMEALDRSGFSALYVVDHPQFPILSPWPFLAWAAARTTRLRLGTHVTGVPFHSPQSLAKQVATVDILSGGRAVVGLGTGYEHEDFEPYGYPMLPFRERAEQLEECMQILRSFWTQETTDFAGKHYQLTGGAKFEPKPVQQPHPPMLVGFNTSGVLMKVAARQADGMNTWQLGAAAVAPLADEFRQLADASGRKAGDLAVTADVVFARGATAEGATELAHMIRDRARGWGRATRSTNWDASGVLHGDADNMVEQAQAFARAGVSELTVSIGTPEDMLWFAESVIPRAAKG
ncbi:MAG: LLM class flavin-dependent oxidoreductase [Dehalococcoidia bacterium]|nr:LLM class flavin-dependent oxidoreductase [Dehalococcoidia bacterium]